MAFILNLLGFGEKKTANKVKTDEIKVNKWDSSALKNALDDSAKKWYKEKRDQKLTVLHRLIDIRIALTLSGVIIAGFACLYDYLRPFPASYWVIVICASSYFALMTALTAFAWFVERGCIFEALEKDEAGIDPDNRIVLASFMQRYKETYRLRLTYTDGKSKRCVDDELRRASQSISMKMACCSLVSSRMTSLNYTKLPQLTRAVSEGRVIRRSATSKTR